MRRSLAIQALLLGLAGGAAMALSPFGIGLHSMLGDSKAHAETCALVKAAGIRLVRDDLTWAAIEKQKGEYTWPENLEANIGATLAAGLQPLLILDYGNPLYDDGNAPTSPEAVAAYADYCRAAVSHYKGKVKYWEIWNEPNLDHFWKPKADVTKYIPLLQAAYKACKEADPNCFVVGVCTAGVDLDFITKVLAAGGMQHMDALSIHPYCYPRPPEQSFPGQIAAVRKLMDSQGGKGKPIWITEVGWPTHIGSGGVTPEVQAHMLVRAYMESIAAGVETTLWYWFGNDGPNPAYNEDHFGIRFRDGSPKPAYTAYQTMTTELDGMEYARSLGLGPKARARVFRGEGETTAVLSTVEGLQTVTLKVGSGPVEVLGELGGRPQILYPINGQIALTLSEAPIYLKCDEDLTQSAVQSPNLIEVAPLEKEIPAGTSGTLEVLITNPCKSSMTGEIRLTAPGATLTPVPFRIDIGKEAKLPIKLSPPAKWKEPWPVTMQVIIDGRPAALLQAQVSPAKPAQ